MPASILDLHRRMSRWPCGRWLFSRLVCLKAPYFASIAPRIERLEPGRCEATLRHRRRVGNHLGGVHAIALCNLAELAAGMMAEATVPADMRWIPKGMSVEYLKKAVGSMHGTATPEAAAPLAGASGEWPVRVEVVDGAGDTVFRARVLMWLSPRKRG